MTEAPTFRWLTRQAPIARASLTIESERRDRVIAAVPPIICGLIIFGPAAFGVTALTVVVCLVSSNLLNRILMRPKDGAMLQALLIGLVLAITLPPNVTWYVPVTAALLATAVGLGLQPTANEALWHPALVGRIGAQLFYPQQLMPTEWPVLARGHLLTGEIANAAQPGTFYGWFATTAPGNAEALRIDNPLTLINALRDAPEQGASAVSELIRDRLPPWEDTLLGLTGGGIGETSAIILLASAGYLVFRGIVPWFVPVATLLSALLAAAALPIALPGPGGPAFPATLFDGGAPVGWMLVLFEITSGELLAVTVFLATDWATTPMTRRGQLLFSVIVGVLAIVLARAGLVPGAGYWAVLFANLLAPGLDALSRRRVLGARGIRAIDAARA